MKALKITYKILLTVTFVFMVVAIMALLMTNVPEHLFEEGSMRFLILTSLSFFIGFALSFVNNKLANVLGLALEGVGFIFFLPFYFINCNYVGVFDGILYLLSMLCLITAVILYAISEKKPNALVKASGEDEVMTKLLKWKELQDKNIITAEEFEAKKKEVLTKFVEE